MVFETPQEKPSNGYDLKSEGAKAQPFSFDEIYAPEKPSTKPKGTGEKFMPRFAPGGTPKEQPEFFRQFPERDVIEPANVRQRFADSYFMSALNSLAGSPQGVELIQKMIHSNGNGSYTITFPGDRKNPITVEEKEYMDPRTFGHASNRTNWADLIEYAFAKRQYGSIQTANMAHSGQHDDYSRAINSPEEALKLLTGKEARTLDITDPKVSVDFLEKQIIQSLDSGEAVTAKTGPSFFGFWGRNQPLFENHTYSVQGYDSQNKILWLHDPTRTHSYLGNPGRVWDGMTVREHGDLTMSVKAFQENFDFLNIGPVK